MPWTTLPTKNEEGIWKKGSPKRVPWRRSSDEENYIYPKDSRGKWMPNYEDPYVVKRALPGGVLILTRMDGKELPLPVNSDIVKKFYAWYDSKMTGFFLY